MRLVYTATQHPVVVGDEITLNDHPFKVSSFDRPHKPDSEGKIVLVSAEDPMGMDAIGSLFYVSVIGAEWIEREDRVPCCRTCGYPLEEVDNSATLDCGRDCIHCMSHKAYMGCLTQRLPVDA